MFNPLNLLFNILIYIGSGFIYVGSTLHLAFNTKTGKYLEQKQIILLKQRQLDKELVAAFNDLDKILKKVEEKKKKE